MNFEEHAGKPLLRAVGIVTPEGRLASSPDVAAIIAGEIGPAVVKAQVAAGKRGKAGGIKLVSGAGEARQAAAEILGMDISGHTVEAGLVEAQVAIKAELYAAVLNDPQSKGPLILFSPEGGMDIEEIAANHPDRLMRFAVDIRHGFDPEGVRDALPAFADVGAGVNFSCGAIVVNYDGYKKTRSTIGDGAFIGCNANLVSPVEIAPRGFVAAGSTITKDVPEDALAVERSEQRHVEGWSRRKGRKKPDPET